MFQGALHVKSVRIKFPYWEKSAGTQHYRNTIWSFYKNDPWNILDSVAFSLWIIGFITRFIVRDHAFEVSKYKNQRKSSKFIFILIEYV